MRFISVIAAPILALGSLACDGDDAADASSGGGSSSGAGASGGQGGGSTGVGAGSGGSLVTPNQSCTSPSPPFTTAEQALVDLPAESWFAAPDSKLRAVCPTGADGCGNVVDAWSGGAFDPVHNQLLVFGGGHADYSGNEVYAFELGNLAWARITEPSPSSYMNQDPLPDGQPVSRHSYDGISYVAHTDRMLVHGGSRWQDGSGTNVTWAFDPGAKVWTDRQPAGAPSLANCCDEASAYYPVSRRVYFHITKSLSAYDWDANAWVVLQEYGRPPYWPRYEVWGDKRGVVDTKRGLVWFFGAGLVLTYDIQAAAHVTDDWITQGGEPFSNAEAVAAYPEQIIETGGGEIITASAPGVDYDTAADDLVAWVGGAPWVLDLDSKIWSQSAATDGPAAPLQHGTFGRWRYIARLNVFVLLNSVDDDIHFYKHTAGCGE